MIITMEDIRAARMCAYGARQFFKIHNLNWHKFLKEGIDLKEVEHIDDILAKKVIEAAHDRNK